MIVVSGRTRARASPRRRQEHVVVTRQGVVPRRTRRRVRSPSPTPARWANERRQRARRGRARTHARDSDSSPLALAWNRSERATVLGVLDASALARGRARCPAARMRGQRPLNKHHVLRSRRAGFGLALVERTSPHALTHKSLRLSVRRRTRYAQRLGRRVRQGCRLLRTWCIVLSPGRALLRGTQALDASPTCQTPQRPNSTP